MKTVIILLLIAVIIGLTASQCNEVGLFGTKEGYIVHDDTESPYYQYKVPTIHARDTAQYILGPHEIETIPNN